MAIAVALGYLSDIHRLWFQPRAMLVNCLLECNQLKLIAMKWMVAIAMALSDLLIFIAFGFNQGQYGKLLIRMQSAEADCNEMNGGYCDGLRRFV